MDYSDELKELLQNQQLQYQTFKQHVNVVPDSFQESASSELRLYELTSIANGLEGEDYSSQNLAETAVQLTADTYEHLGIIQSDIQTFTGEKVYIAPDYHGRGHSRSWDNIVSDLEESMEQAETEYAWANKRDKNERGLEEF